MRHPRAEPATDLVRGDAVWAALTACAALAIYVRTLAPGVIPILDTPGFQFVGRVLGTLHNPGYPAYTLITWLWSYLPAGSLAYRINLFSAVMASLAVAGAFVLLRLLGVRRLLASAAALGMAFGSVYWSQAVIAEVYALNAALIAWMLAAAVAWGLSKHGWLLSAACGVLAVGLGNHTTIVLFAPALAIYALLVDCRGVLRPRRLAGFLVIVLLGLSQYLFILVRTRMGAVYLESEAATLGELVRVMRGAQFENALFVFPLSRVLGERVAVVLGRFVTGEMTAPVMACAVLGMVALLARRRRDAILLLTGLLGQLVFVLNYDAGDIHVFTIPLLLLLWILAGAGVEELLRWLARTSGPGRVPVTAIALLAAAAFPVWQAARNFTDRDLSDDTEAMRQLDALFTALPDDSFLVRENFVLDRMLMYKILGENAGAGREIQAHHATASAAASMHLSGRHVFAFTETAHRYRYEGINVRFSPLPVYDWTLGQYLSSLPHGSVVALAVPGAHAPAFHRATGDALGLLTTRPSVAGREQAAVAVVGVIGSPSTARVQLDARSSTSASMEGVTARADALTAGIDLRGRERLVSEDGAVLVVLTPGRQLQVVRALSAESGFRLRAGAGSLIPSRVLERMPERAVDTTWDDVGEGTGLWLFTVPAGGRVEIASGLGGGCDLRAVETSSDALQVSRPPAGLRQAGRADSIVLTATELAGAFVGTGCRTRLRVRAPSGTVTVRDVSLAGMLDLPERTVETVLMARTPQAWLLGAGWSAVDTSDTGPFRWIEGPGASLVLPIERRGSMRLRVQAYAAEEGTVDLGLELDGHALHLHSLRAGWGWYDWTLRQPLDPGLHQLSFRAASAGGPAGRVGISQIEVLPGGGP